jgi:hypothetical protein
MSPQVIFNTTEISTPGGVPTTTGNAFIVGLTDEGPPPSGPAYVYCQSISQYITAFGARSTTSAITYDWLDEFFHDGGSGAYVARVTDNTATAATLTLQDSGPEPTVLVTALTAGVDGNSTNIVVTRGTGTTFSGTTTSSSEAVTSVSSFANVGVGTYVTGTGIAAGTYVSAINVSASTLTLSANATTSGSKTLTPTTFTVEVENSAGNVLETWGPYYETSQLFAITTSNYVTFAQSTGSGNTTNQPAALTSTALSGGANPDDISSASYVTALAQFPSSLGPGTVAVPSQTNSTVWTGLLAHASANNRFAALDTADGTTSASVVTSVGSIGTTTTASYGIFTQGSLTIPGITPGTTRTVAGSAAVAALRAQVAATPSQNTAPCGTGWGLSYPLSFTTFFGPGGQWLQSDVNTMEAGGINCFANFYGTLCLYGFVTPVPQTTDSVYWQASASCERLALVNDGNAAVAPFLFDTIDGAGNTITAFTAALKAVLQNHWASGALYGDTAADAGIVNVGPPINTPTTAALGQLNANCQVRISPYSDLVDVTITTVPLTAAVV